LVASCACRLNGSKMPRMSFSVMSVGRPFDIDCERGLRFLPFDESIAGSENATRDHL
jgi:hypothetical protein